jgi:hypothetical protein
MYVNYHLLKIGASFVIIAFLSTLAKVLVLGMFTVTPTLEIYPKARYAILKAAFLSAFSSPHLAQVNNPCIFRTPF